MQSTVQRLHVPPGSRPQKQKQNLAIKALDSIHERAQVVSNLSLSHGRRLKVESPPTATKRKRRPTVEYNISFADLGDPELESKNDIPDLYSDSEELPLTILSAPMPAQSRNTSCNPVQSKSRRYTEPETTRDIPRPKRMKHSPIKTVSRLLLR